MYGEKFFLFIHFQLITLSGLHGDSPGKEPNCLCKRWVRFLGQEDSLEEEMVPYFSILAWEIPWTEEPGGLQSMGSQELDMI